MSTAAFSRSRLIALVVACAMFMAQLDGAVVTLALPAIARSVQASPVQLTLGITVYLLAQVVILPTGGWIADRFGARNVFTTAIAAFTVASVFCALSPSLGLFVAARTLQGCAAALMAPVGRILLLESTAKRDLVSVMTISTVPMLLAPTVGPALGGFITTYWTWQWIFLLNVPFGIAAIGLAVRLIPRSPQMAKRPFDAVGFLLFAGASTLVIYALQSLADHFPQWILPAALMTGGMLLAALAVRHALLSVHPIISLASATIPTFAIAALKGGSLVRLPVRALPFLLPMMFQLALGMTALRAGLLLMALNGGDLLLKVATTRTLRRFGFRTVLLVSTVLSGLSIGVCASFSAATPFAVIFAILLIAGMFRSLLFTGLSTLVFADIPSTELSSASILWNIVQQGTSVLGVSLSSILLAVGAQLAGEPRNALSLGDFRFALCVMGVICLSAVLSLRHLAPHAGASVSGHQPATLPAAEAD